MFVGADEIAGGKHVGRRGVEDSFRIGAETAESDTDREGDVGLGVGGLVSRGRREEEGAFGRSTASWAGLGIVQSDGPGDFELDGGLSVELIRRERALDARRDLFRATDSQNRDSV